VITFLDGMWIHRPTPPHCAALGEALAKLHLAGLDFHKTRANALSVAWRAHARWSCTLRGSPAYCSPQTRSSAALSESTPLSSSQTTMQIPFCGGIEKD